MKYEYPAIAVHQATGQGIFLGNAGSFIAFCVAATDAELLAPEFGVPPSALMEQLPFEAWLRRGNLEHAKITALPRARPITNQKKPYHDRVHCNDRPKQNEIHAMQSLYFITLVSKFM